MIPTAHAVTMIKGMLLSKVKYLTITRTNVTTALVTEETDTYLVII